MQRGSECARLPIRRLGDHHPACSPDDIRRGPRRCEAGACYEAPAEPNEPEMQTTFSLAQLADPDMRGSAHSKEGTGLSQPIES